MDVVCMLSVAGYAWNFDCAQPSLHIAYACSDRTRPVTMQYEVGQKGVGLARLRPGACMY